MAIRERMNAIEPDDPAIAGLTVAAWLDRQDDSADAKAAFHSMIEGLWCQADRAVPLWYLIDNDRRITNEVSELQYFLGETMHSLADDLARRARRPAASEHAGDAASSMAPAASGVTASGQVFEAGHADRRRAAGHGVAHRLAPPLPERSARRSAPGRAER